MSSDITVEHRQQEYRFCIRCDDKEAELTYELSTGRVNFIRTYVPFRLRGKGLAEQLVDAGLRWAEEQQLSVDTRCWFVEKVLEQS